MQLSSIDFLLFATIIAAVNYLLPSSRRTVWLLLCSYVFYLTWSPWLVGMLIVFTLVNFVWGQVISCGPSPKQKQVLLWLGITFNLSYVAVLKYVDFFRRVAERLFSISNLQDLSVLRILVPIGLSYLMLQAIGYLIDVQKGRLQAETNLLDFALYFAYFPKLLSGPIEYARTFLPFLKQHRPITSHDIQHGLYLILEGLVRKRIIADLLLSSRPEMLFTEPVSFGQCNLFLWLFASTYALYMDFSGYTRIARGISSLLGITLSPNFAAPFFSTSITEFWNRWHMTFSRWLRDYIYLPFSISLIKKTRSPEHILTIATPIGATVFASALWHEVAAHHLIWAGILGLLLTAEQYRKVRYPNIDRRRTTLTLTLWRLVFLMMFSVAVVSFLYPIDKVFDIWSALFVEADFLFEPVTLRIFILIIPAILWEWLHYRSDNEFFMFDAPWWVCSILLTLSIILLVLVITTDLSTIPFIYQGF